MKHLFIYLFLVCLTVICKIRNENEGSLSINAKNVNQQILSDYSLSKLLLSSRLSINIESTNTI